MNQNLSELSNLSSSDYLVWDEKSMRNFLIKTLNKSGVYTDQIFPGSDIGVLIDITAYAFALMTYVANHNASESMFSDAQLYENINRLSKLLGYNPKGYTTSSVECRIIVNETNYLANSNFSGVTAAVPYSIPRYASCLSTNGIRYSLASGENGSGTNDAQSFPFMIDVVAGRPKISYSDNPIFLEGTWKLYPTQITTSGDANETYILAKISGILAYPYIDVYVYDSVENTYTKWTQTSNLYDCSATDTAYSVRINEHKQAEIKFGDGVYGKKLGENKVLYIIYLESTGEDGVIKTGELDGNSEMVCEIDGLTASEFKTICFGGTDEFDSEFPFFSTVGSKIYTDILSIENIEASTDISDYEDVDSIRASAPSAFRSGQRLVTKNDYEQFIRNNYSDLVLDCHVMNNFSYCAEFQNYILQHWDQTGNPMVRIRQFNYAYADACDHNNIYLWMKARSKDTLPGFVKKSIINAMQNIKCIADEPIPMDALPVVFTPYVKGDFSINNWDSGNTNKIIIVKNQSSLNNNDRIKSSAVQVISDFFSDENQTIGREVSLSDLYSKLLAIDGVKEVRTSYIYNGKEEATVSGLSFVYWTPTILNGSDKTVALNSTVKLHNFQFAKLRKPSKVSDIVEVSGTSQYAPSPEY